MSPFHKFVVASIHYFYSWRPFKNSPNPSFPYCSMVEQRKYSTGGIQQWRVKKKLFPNTFLSEFDYSDTTEATFLLVNIENMFSMNCFAHLCSPQSLNNVDHLRPPALLKVVNTKIAKLRQSCDSFCMHKLQETIFYCTIEINNCFIHCCNYQLLYALLQFSTF